MTIINTREEKEEKKVQGRKIKDNIIDIQDTR